MVNLHITSSCDGGCSSRADDDIVISRSRVMPKLKYLGLGDDPCPQFTTGVTVKGLVALAHHCQNLSVLRTHFQMDILSDPPASPRMTLNAESTDSWTDRALTDLEVGEISVSEESVLTVTLALLRISPRIETIDRADRGWAKVKDAISRSKRNYRLSK